MNYNCCFTRVIIIDDSAIDRQIARFFVKHTNLAREVKEFDAALTALSYLHEHLSELKQSRTLILLDLRMPEMNGFDFLSAAQGILKTLDSKCEVIMVSAELDNARGKEAVHHLVKMYISKPLNKTKIQAMQFDQSEWCAQAS